MKVAGEIEISNMIKTRTQLQQRFIEISEDNSLPKNFGTGENLIGLPPNDIYQLGFAAAFFECNRAVNQYVNGQAAQSMPDDGWMPYGEKSPDRPGHYYVTTHDGRVVTSAYYCGAFDRDIIAWRPAELPPPYALCKGKGKL